MDIASGQRGSARHVGRQGCGSALQRRFSGAGCVCRPSCLAAGWLLCSAGMSLVVCEMMWCIRPWSPEERAWAVWRVLACQRREQLLRRRHGFVGARPLMTCVEEYICSHGSTSHRTGSSWRARSGRSDCFRGSSNGCRSDGASSIGAIGDTSTGRTIKAKEQ